MKEPSPDELITMSEAQRILGVSQVKMSKIVKEGMLRHWRNPLDARVKLVSRRHVEALKSMRTKAA